LAAMNSAACRASPWNPPSRIHRENGGGPGVRLRKLGKEKPRK
jgi:hypothetical protein